MWTSDEQPLRHRAGTPIQTSAYPKENIPSFRALSSAVHDAGGKIFRRDLVLVGSHWSVAAAQSGCTVPWCLGVTVSLRRYGSRLIRWVGMRSTDSDAFRQSTSNLGQAGYDGVMLHAHTGRSSNSSSPPISTGGLMNTEEVSRTVFDCSSVPRGGSRGIGQGTGRGNAVELRRTSREATAQRRLASR